MVSTINFIMIIVVGLGCIALPLGTFLVVSKKNKRITGALFAGILAFFVFQMVIRVPILQTVLVKMTWFQNMATNNLVLYALFLGFTAALFETVGRYVTMKLFLKNKKNYHNGISHGIGHGGIEMILLISLNYISFIFIAMQINAGTYDEVIANTIAMAGEQAGNNLILIKDILINTPTSDYLLAFLERILTFVVHIGLSLMIMEGIFRKKEGKFFFFALCIHTALDTSVVIMAGLNVPVLIIEGVALVFALGMIYYIKTSKKRFEDKSDSEMEYAELSEVDCS